MEYNEIIKSLREDKDLNQSQLSKIFNISQQTLSQYETKRRTLPIEILKKYAEYFNVSTDYILGLTNDPKPHWNIKNNVTINGGLNISGGKNKLHFE